MYAIIRDGGRQHKVAEGQELLVDLRDVEPGAGVEFDEVLLISANDATQVGTPLVEGAKVVAEAVGKVKGEKLQVQHFRRRKDSRDCTGHRQAYLKVVIKEIAVEDYDYPHLGLRVVTGPGVYIRSLARDMGRELGTGGFLDGLVRTRVGRFSLEDCVALDDLAARHGEDAS